MNREQLMKMSKKELKARLVTVGKEAQDKSGEELTALMDEARTIGEILDEIKAREELAKAAQAAAGEGEGPDGNAGEGAEVKDQARAKSGKALKAGAKTTYNAKKIAKPMAALSTTTGVVMPHHTSPDIAPTFEKLCQTARVTEDKAKGIRTVKIGGIGNATGKKYLLRFVHKDTQDGNIRVTIVGNNQAGFTIAFAKDSETVIDAEFKAQPMDKEGTLILYTEDIDKTE